MKKTPQPKLGCRETCPTAGPMGVKRLTHILVEPEPYGTTGSVLIGRGTHPRTGIASEHARLRLFIDILKSCRSVFQITHLMNIRRS